MLIASQLQCISWVSMNYTGPSSLYCVVSEFILNVQNCIFQLKWLGEKRKEKKKERFILYFSCFHWQFWVSPRKTSQRDIGISKTSEKHHQPWVLFYLLLVHSCLPKHLSLHRVQSEHFCWGLKTEYYICCFLGDLSSWRLLNGKVVNNLFKTLHYNF